MAVSEAAFRNALAHFASGVTVVTGVGPNGSLAGVTASAFTSVSLDPPLVSVCLGKETACLDTFAAGSHFNVNILAADQQCLSENFARRAKNKFAGINHRIGQNGCPQLPGCLAIVQCIREAVFEGGDHLVILGRVEKVDDLQPGEPLIHFCGTYHRLGETV